MAPITENHADPDGDRSKSQRSRLFDNDREVSTNTITNDNADGTPIVTLAKYDVEHLATFSTANDNDNGEPTATANKSKFKQQTNDASSATEPKVALQKLFELEKLSGIWTQRMQIQLQPDVMLILDCETNSIVERFHCDRVSKPEAFNHYNDIYNNIIVFIIDQRQAQFDGSSTNRENCDNQQQQQIATGELHIFQCVSHKAKQLVSDIHDWKRAQNATRNGKENPGIVPLSFEDKKLVDEQSLLSVAKLSDLEEPQDMRNETNSASKLDTEEQNMGPDDSQRSRPAVTVASSSNASETVPIVNVNVKETVQVFNQIAALREKSGSANQTARPLSDASSSSQQTSGPAVLSAGGQFYKQRSIRVTLAPKGGSTEDEAAAATATATARPVSPTHKITNSSGQQAQASSSSSSSINASSSVSSSSRSDNHHQHGNDDITKKLPTGMVSSVSSSSSSSKDDNHRQQQQHYSHQNAISQKQIAIQQLQQAQQQQQHQSVKTNNYNGHTQSSLSNHQHLNQHSHHQHNQPLQQLQKPSSGGGVKSGKGSSSSSSTSNKLSSSSSSSSSRPPASNGHHHHHHHHHGGRSRVSPPLEQDHHRALEQVNTNESYVSVLNHCFDDIEKFIIRLQHAYAAMRELQAQKKQTRRSSSTALATTTISNGHPSGSKSQAARNGCAPLPPPPPSLTAPELAMLSAQARGPSPDDFFEILSKFKLAFNLLAKLKGCIHEPNAPELVHFLFTPLAIIIESARNVTPPVDPTVVGIPYLNKDALDLLSNCCTSKESDLWLSLGSNWTQTIDIQVLKSSRLPNSFQPIFSDGWAPVISELELIGLVVPPPPSSSSPTGNGADQHYRAMREPPQDGPLMIKDSSLSHGGRKAQHVARNARVDSVELSGNGLAQVKSTKKRIAAPKDATAPINYMDPPGSYAPGGGYHLESTIVEDPPPMAAGHDASQYRVPDVSGRPSRSAARMSMPASEKSSRTASSTKYTSIGVPIGGPKSRHSEYPDYGHYAPPLAANGSSLGGFPRPQAALTGSGYSSYLTTHPSDGYTELHGESVGMPPQRYLPGAGPSNGGYASRHPHRNDSRGFSTGYDRGESGYPLPAHQVGMYEDDVINSGADLLASEAEHEAMLLDIGPAQTEWFYELKSRGAYIVRVLFTREANNDKELTVRRGEILEILDDSRKWWKARNIDLQVAYVPHTILAVMEHYQTIDELLTNSPGGMMMMINEEPNAVAAARYNYNGGGGIRGGGAGGEDERHSKTAKGAFRYF